MTSRSRWAASRLERCPPRPANPLFEELRIRSLRQHLRVVVAFQEHRIQRADHAGQSIEDVPQIGEDAQSLPAVVDDESHAIHTVMGRRYRLHGHVADAQDAAGLEMAHVVQPAQLTPLGRECQRFGRDMNRHAELPLEDTDRAAMVAVVVRHEERVHLPDIPSIPGQSLLGLLATDAGVKQQPYARCFDVGAVSVAARLENDESHAAIV